MDERTKTVNLLSGKVAHPDIDLATFDTTDIKNDQKMNEMREQIIPLDLGKGKGGENILTKTVGLTTQNVKETLKALNPPALSNPRGAQTDTIARSTPDIRETDQIHRNR